MNYVQLRKKFRNSRVNLDTALNEISEWTNKLLLQCHALRDEISLFAEIPGLATNATLRDALKLAPTRLRQAWH